MKKNVEFCMKKFVEKCRIMKKKNVGKFRIMKK